MKDYRKYATRESGAENYSEKRDPDCDTCWKKRNGCTQARSGSFCARWQSKKPEPEGPDPNDAWSRGDEVTF